MNKDNIIHINQIISLVTTSVGYDVSKSVGISWHSKLPGTIFEYRKEESTEFIKITPNEDYWSIEQSYIKDTYQDKRYICRVSLDNLESDTKYIYRIIINNLSTQEYSFKTIDLKNNKCSFLSFADFQYSNNQTTIDLIKTFITENPDVNLITCSGDIADEGYCEASHQFLFNSNIFSDSILAFAAGDHEYWGSMLSPIKMLEKPYAYNKLFNNPHNGCDGLLNTSYYFKYNRILFIVLDCGDSNITSDNPIFINQANWIDNVITNNEHDFVIVNMHKSLYGDIKQDSTVKKIAPLFTNVFDKHNVDLVISGHDHEYSRTKPLYNNTINKRGTVYLDIGSSGDKRRSTGESIKSSDLYEKYIDLVKNNYSLGIVGFLNNEELLLEIRNQSYELVDYCKIIKKKHI